LENAPGQPSPAIEINIFLEKALDSIRASTLDEIKSCNWYTRFSDIDTKICSRHRPMIDRAKAEGKTQALDEAIAVVEGISPEVIGLLIPRKDILAALQSLKKQPTPSDQ
jgi:hypothetical protein